MTFCHHRHDRAPIRCNTKTKEELFRLAHHASARNPKRRGLASEDDFRSGIALRDLVARVRCEKSIALSMGLTDPA